MARVCEFCAKQTVAGKRIQQHHSIQWRFRAKRTNRTFKPNIRKIKVLVGGTPMKVNTCMKCYKRIRKNLKAAEESQG